MRFEPHSALTTANSNPCRRACLANVNASAGGAIATIPARCQRQKTIACALLPSSRDMVETAPPTRGAFAAAFIGRNAPSRQTPEKPFDAADIRDFRAARRARARAGRQVDLASRADARRARGRRE